MKNTHRIRKYIVLTNTTEGREDYSCICSKFSKDGILYSHILKILVETEVSKIPEKYIIERWRKKEKKMHIMKVASSTATNDILRFNALSRIAAELTSKGAKTDEAMEYLVGEFSKIRKNLDMMLSSMNVEIPLITAATEAPTVPTEYPPPPQAPAEATQLPNQQQPETEEHSEYAPNLQDPLTTKKKGRPEKPKRWKAIVETEREKMKAKEQKKTKKTDTSSKEENIKIYKINRLVLILCKICRSQWKKVKRR